jgi:hypothetical protein
VGFATGRRWKMSKCLNDQCTAHNIDYVSGCQITHKDDLKTCRLYKPLKSKKDAVAKIQCSDGLSVELLKERCEGLETIQTCFEDAAKNVITGWESDDKQMFIRGIKGLQILMGNR